MNIKQKLGLKIKEIRKSKKYTQEYVAEKIGIETKSLSNIERGIFYPTAENLEKILNILEVLPKDLFDFEYFRSDDDLKQELFEIINANPDKIQEIYKIVKVII